MAEGSFRMESESFNAEDMDEGSDEVREEEMVEGNDYEEFGAFGGYGAFTSFDMRLLRAFGSLGPGFRILSVRPLLGHLLALLKGGMGVVCKGEWVKGRVDGGGPPSLSKPNVSSAGRKEVGEGLEGGGGWLAAWRRLAGTGKHDASVQSCLPSPTPLSRLAE